MTTIIYLSQKPWQHPTNEKYVKLCFISSFCCSFTGWVEKKGGWEFHYRNFWNELLRQQLMIETELDIAVASRKKNCNLIILPIHCITASAQHFFIILCMASSLIPRKSTTYIFHIPHFPPQSAWKFTATSLMILICQKDVWYSLYHLAKQQQWKGCEGGNFFLDCDIFYYNSLFYCTKLFASNIFMFSLAFFFLLWRQEKIMIICFREHHNDLLFSVEFETFQVFFNNNNERKLKGRIYSDFSRFSFLPLGLLFCLLSRLLTSNLYPS